MRFDQAYMIPYKLVKETHALHASEERLIWGMCGILQENQTLSHDYACGAASLLTILNSREHVRFSYETLSILPQSITSKSFKPPSHNQKCQPELHPHPRCTAAPLSSSTPRQLNLNSLRNHAPDSPNRQHRNRQIHHLHHPLLSTSLPPPN